jgi:hypothetical protein
VQADDALIGPEVEHLGELERGVVPRQAACVAIHVMVDCTMRDPDELVTDGLPARRA